MWNYPITRCPRKCQRECKINLILPNLMLIPSATVNARLNRSTTRNIIFLLESTRPSHSDKLFRYCEVIYKMIIQKEFKFKLPNQGNKYDSSTDPLIRLSTIKLSCIIKEKTMIVASRAFAMTHKKGIGTQYHNLSLAPSRSSISFSRCSQNNSL